MSSELRSARQLQYLTGSELAPFLSVERGVLINYTYIYIYNYICIRVFRLHSYNTRKLALEKRALSQLSNSVSTWLLNVSNLRFFLFNFVLGSPLGNRGVRTMTRCPYVP